MKDEKYITLYQNNDKVLELLQRINLGQMVQVTTSRGTSVENKDNNSWAGKISASGNIPGIVGLDGTGSLNKEKGQQSFNSDNIEYTHIYGDSFYLKYVIDSLIEKNDISFMNIQANLKSIKNGDLVILESSFLPNAVDSLFETLDLEWIKKIINYLRVKNINAELTAVPNANKVSIDKIRQKHDNLADQRIVLAESIYSFLENEFKNKKVEELFSDIDNFYNVVVSCEESWFNVSNKNQIYNGIYKTFGKVVEVSNGEPSRFSNNKLLKITGEDELNSIFEYIHNSFIPKTSAKDTLLKENLTGIAESLSSSIFSPNKNNGKTFKIIPLAIYV